MGWWGTVVLTLAGVVALTGVGHAQEAQGRQERCAQIFGSVVSNLAAEQYPTMLRVAEEHMRACPGPQSAFALGLAQANMVDRGLVDEAPRRAQMRRDALRNLRVVATQGERLPQSWLMTVSEWIVALESMVLPEPMAGKPQLLSPAHGVGASTLDVPIPRAPPPQPRPAFPWGPTALWGVGGGLAITGVVLAVMALDQKGAAQTAAAERRVRLESLTVAELNAYDWRIRRLDRNAGSLGSWATLSWVVGGAAAVGGTLWYFALPPEGAWRWSALPGGLSVTARF